MKRRGSFATVAAAACLLWGAACSRPAGLSETDKSAIREAETSFEKLVNARDFKALAAMYTEDAVLMPAGAPAIQGRAAIQEFFSKGPPLTDFRIQVLEIEGAGNIAYTREVITYTLNPPGSATVRAREKVMAIWRKQGDGAWFVSRDISNADPL